jgi:putative oxidoreductase
MQACMSRDDLAKLFLRIAVGGLMLLHGIGKVRGGIASIASRVTEHGLPAFISYGVYIGELVAPLAMVLGIFARPAAAIVAVNMAFAVWLVHVDDLVRLGKGGGWALELQGLYFVGAVAVALLGAGRYALK